MGVTTDRDLKIVSHFDDPNDQNAWRSYLFDQCLSLSEQGICAENVYFLTTKCIALGVYVLEMDEFSKKIIYLATCSDLHEAGLEL